MPRHSESTLAAIKETVDIVALVGEYLPLHRSGSKFKALCPFHDDHNPSLELNPERQSFKCWSCGAGGDVFDFVKDYERVEFSEALRMLAERAGIALEAPSADRATPKGPSKTELLAALEWAGVQFAEALARSDEARGYLERRGIHAESVARFGLGFAPDRRDWLQGRAAAAGIGSEALEKAGLTARGEATGLARDRFRGRLIFPIRDLRGRTIGFGGRILPEVEKTWTEAGRGIAKYLNSPETPVFQKRRTLYAADLARADARREGWLAVVEGYTDVIAAHQAGLANCVGTLGTALGDDHIASLRRLADRVVLVFDGDEAGQKAADRSLELFLGHEVDVRVLTLPEGLDPDEFLLTRGADTFRGLVAAALDPLEFAVARAAARYDFASAEGTRQAAEWLLGLLATIPTPTRAGLDLKVAKALDTLSQRLRIPVSDLARGLRAIRQPARSASQRLSEPGHPAPVSESRTICPAELDTTDRQLIEILLHEPTVVGELRHRVRPAILRDAPLQTILSSCYDLHDEGQVPIPERVLSRLEDPELRALMAGLMAPRIDPLPLSDQTRQAPTEVLLANLLSTIEGRAWRERLRDVETTLRETNPIAHPQKHLALLGEQLRIYQVLHKLKKQPGSNPTKSLS